MGNYDITDEYDVEFRKLLKGRTYMAAVSPWFFTVNTLPPSGPGRCSPIAALWG
jgi:hypothetical protein